jgi:hypothetical protein
MVVRENEIPEELEHICSLDEIKIRQRARDKQILEGDRNTTYFHAIANHRNRKKRIDRLRGPNGMVTETSEILKIAANYYKELFGWEDRGNTSLDSHFLEASDRVSPRENAELTTPFSEQEIKRVIFDSYAEGAPGPNGLSFLFLSEILRHY